MTNATSATTSMTPIACRRRLTTKANKGSASLRRVRRKRGGAGVQAPAPPAFALVGLPGRELGVAELRLVVHHDRKIEALGHRPGDDLVVERDVDDVVLHLLPCRGDESVALGDVDLAGHVRHQLLEPVALVAGRVPGP